MVIERGLTDLPMLVSSGAQLFIGSVLEREQGVVGTGHGQKDLVEFALRRSLMTGLDVLDDKDHREVSAATRVWKMVSHRAGNPTAMLTRIHTPAPPMTSTAASGRDAYRSALDSHRLIRERSTGGPGSATESPSAALASCGPLGLLHAALGRLLLPARHHGAPLRSRVASRHALPGSFTG
jgi:hypothetical protein